MSKDDLIFFIAIVITVVVICLGSYLSSYFVCQGKANALGYKFNYKLFQGCLLIKEDGSRVLLEQLRAIK